MPSRVVDYGVGADIGIDESAKSRYVLFAEFDGERRPGDPERFIGAFDEGLCRENRVYREHRSGDTAILAPELVMLPAGSVKRFMEEAGSGNVQTKFPRILDDRKKLILRGYAG
jgi:hypothetical protein